MTTADDYRETTADRTRSPTRRSEPMAKKTDEQDRTILAERWAAAVAEMDNAREALDAARAKEREAWAALERSRSFSIPSEDA
jgi:hypothetical protein